MISIRPREVWRYLGYRGAVPDAEMRRKIGACEQELQKAVSPLHVAREFPLFFGMSSDAPGKGRPRDRSPESDRTDASHMQIGPLALTSTALARNLHGCERAILFAATLGIGADRLIRRAAVARMSDAVIYQALAAEMIESFCDAINAELAAEAAARGYRLHPRFSPGYGDLDISCQRALTSVLNTAKEIGLTLTDSLMMVPTKSVTAIIGMEYVGMDVPDGEHAAHAHMTEQAGCALCTMTDCAYRKSVASGQPIPEQL